MIQSNLTIQYGMNTKMRTNKEATDQNLSSPPNKHWEKFFARFSEIEQLPIENWRAIHLIAYFAKKYKEQYKLDYQFKFNTTSPSKSFEVFQMNSLASKITSDPISLRNYIDYIFQEEVPKLKKRFRSISILNKDETVNHYKWNVLLPQNKEDLHLDRSTELPPNFQTILKNYPIKTYGELAFMHTAWKTRLIKDEAFGVAIDALVKAGFNLSLLERIV